MAIISDELREVRELFAVPRRSEIVEWEADLDDEDLIEREDMVVTVTQGGYIKRTPLTEYRAQRRGGKGSAGMATKDEDFVTRLFVANTHTALLFFTTAGMVYTLKCWRLPLGAPQRPRQGDRQHPADPAGGLDRRDHADRRARGGVGEPAGDVRDLGRRRAPQRARRLHQRQDATARSR